MSNFTGAFSITKFNDPITGKRLWTLNDDLRYYVGSENSDFYIDIKAGYCSDGGSLPRVAWMIDHPVGDGGPAYFIHDSLYQSKLLPRLQTDEILYEGLYVLDLNWCRRTLIYQSVRACGWYAWDQKTNEEITEARKYVRVVKDGKLI